MLKNKYIVVIYFFTNAVLTSVASVWNASISSSRIGCLESRGKCSSECAFEGGSNKCSSDQSDDSDEGSEIKCAPQGLLKDGHCYSMRKPGEFCNFTEQCTDVGLAQYYCIGNKCQIPPECPPGHASVGAECFSFAVTGGDCIHPIQCLSGSVCIRGKCRGPCDENQLFTDDNCVNYEGGGCIARTCVKHKCPRAFPSCNYVPQRDEYLCCERQIRSAIQCPDPLSIPQLNQVTNEVVNCMVESCGPGFSCQFSSSGRGSYICCSVPSNRHRNIQYQMLIRKGKRKKKINSNFLLT